MKHLFSVILTVTLFATTAFAGVEGGGGGARGFAPGTGGGGGGWTFGSGGGGTFGSKVFCTSDNFEISGPAVLRKTFMKDLFEMNDGVVNCEVESNSIDLR